MFGIFQNILQIFQLTRKIDDLLIGGIQFRQPIGNIADNPRAFAELPLHHFR